MRLIVVIRPPGLTDWRSPPVMTSRITAAGIAKPNSSAHVTPTMNSLPPVIIATPTITNTNSPLIATYLMGRAMSLPSWSRG